MTALLANCEKESGQRHSRSRCGHTQPSRLPARSRVHAPTRARTRRVYVRETACKSPLGAVACTAGARHGKAFLRVRAGGAVLPAIHAAVLAVIGWQCRGPIGSAVTVSGVPRGRRWTNQRAGNPLTQWTTAAVPLGSVLAVMAVLPPSHSTVRLWDRHENRNFGSQFWRDLVVTDYGTFRAHTK